MENRSRVLVTGAEGFTGHYVIEDFLAAGYEVFGTSFRKLAQTGNNLDCQMLQMDITDEISVAEAMATAKPNFIIHLAGISFVPHSDTRSIYDINLIGTRNLLSAASRLDVNPECIVLASSANVYGNAMSEVISEQQPICPANDYGVSKAAMEYLAGIFPDLTICIARPFNYTGVSQNRDFLIPKLVSHFKNNKDSIELGNLDVEREFNDVRDVAKVYRRLAENAEQTIANICTGQVYSIRHILSLLQKLSGIEVEVKVNQQFLRKSEISRLAGDPTHLFETIGRFDTFTIEATLSWMLESPYYLDPKS